MPERGEAKSSQHGAKRWHKKVKKAGPLRLKALWVDSTGLERRFEESSPRAKAGHVFRLKPTTWCNRGSKGAQEPVYPPLAEYNIPSLESLVLKDIQGNPRTVILDLDKLWLQVRLLPFVSLSVLHSTCYPGPGPPAYSCHDSAIYSAAMG